MVSIGDPVPAFTLTDNERQPFSSERLAGRKSLIVFIPFPFSGICEGELCTLRDHLADLDALDANVVAISCDTLFSNAKWADLNGFGFPVLSDYWPHGEIARAFGVFDEEKGVATRTTFVVDADGIVRDVIASGSLGTPREYDLYEEALGKF